ncbi:hypothetical protein GCM10010211_51750 [Streptomyces albospinus]|uniref:Uncharacterized protein n=1 Tax=Streptomyces albospinus TaxID=285515 RepID=A0ABQ2VCB7_9ACTN|nr:hypothetical protein [Streptomyces albospinus]GGU79380.1 hypothetical protein GCM10010211_51750 [Streptomyces albospinus]
MTQPTPRSYWCYRTCFRPGSDRMAAGTDLLTPYPGRAIAWIRSEVRLVFAGLANESDRARVMAWLDDLQAAGTAVRELRTGSYTYHLHTATGVRWLWMAHRVSGLPLLTAAGHYRDLSGQTPVR